MAINRAVFQPGRVKIAADDMWPKPAMADDLVLDFETRSSVSLKKAGAYRYAADQSTQVLVASYCIGQGPIKRWRPYKGEPMPHRTRGSHIK